MATRNLAMATRSPAMEHLHMAIRNLAMDTTYNNSSCGVFDLSYLFFLFVEFFHVGKSHPLHYCTFQTIKRLKGYFLPPSVFYTLSHLFSYECYLIKDHSYTFYQIQGNPLQDFLFLLLREGKLNGHFTSGNQSAMKLIAIKMKLST